MLTLDKERVKRILVSREGYEPYQAEFLLKEYPPIRDPLAGTVQQWLSDGTIQGGPIEGVTIQQVIDAKRCEFLVAVRYLNRLLDDNLTESTLARLRKRLTSPRVIE